MGLWHCDSACQKHRDLFVYLFIYLGGPEGCKKNTCIDFSVGIVLMREAVCCENTWHSSYFFPGLVEAKKAFNWCITIQVVSA